MPSPANIICQTCGGNKIIRVNAICADSCIFVCPNHDIHNDVGFVPGEVGIGGGTSIDLTLCLDCGQLQGNWPKELPEKE